METNINAIIDLPANENLPAGLILADFWATWCGPCRMMHPVLEKVAQSQSDAKIIKVNVDDHGSLAASWSVSAVPTIVLMRDGRELQRFVGMQSHTALLEAIAQHK